MHGSKVMLCIKKRDERTDGRTEGRTDENPKSNMSEEGRDIKIHWEGLTHATQPSNYCNERILKESPLEQ